MVNRFRKNLKKRFLDKIIVVAGKNTVPNSGFNKKSKLMWLVLNTETRATYESEQFKFQVSK